MGNVSKVIAAAPDRSSSPAMTEILTPRQLEVLGLLCEGLPNKLIARRLGISGGTVKVHVVQILRAMNVSSRLQAVIAARTLGLVDATYNLLPMQATVSALNAATVQPQPTSDDASRPRVARSERALMVA